MTPTACAAASASRGSQPATSAIQFQIGNVFDENAQILGDTTVEGWNPFRDTRLEPFDPFTETPVEGVRWRKGSNFGKATFNSDYQQPRFYVASAGFRF